jgi:hypothetical protein
MSTIQIGVPESVLPSTGQSPEDFVRKAKFRLALKLLELGRLSSGKAAEMCGMNRVPRRRTRENYAAVTE